MPGKNSEDRSFFSCQKLSSQDYLALVPYFVKNIYSYPFHNEIFQKKPKQGGWGGVGLRIYFFETPPGIFHFFTIPLEIAGKRTLKPWIIHKIVLNPLEIPRPKTTTPGNSTLFFRSFLEIPLRF